MALSSDQNAAYEAALTQLDGDLKLLQARYEQYFLGMERREPGQERDALKKRIQALKREHIRNTGLKFRLASLWQRYLSYERMWQRTVQEIEEGRYRRDLFKAKLHRRDAEADKASDEKVKAAVAEARGAKPKPKARPDGGLADDKLEKLYNAFVTAKKRCREDTSGLTMDAMRKSLAKQIPQIKAKHGAKSVDFKVVIKGGKAVLKAVPR